MRRFFEFIRILFGVIVCLAGMVIFCLSAYIIAVDLYHVGQGWGEDTQLGAILKITEIIGAPYFSGVLVYHSGILSGILIVHLGLLIMGQPLRMVRPWPILSRRLERLTLAPVLRIWRSERPNRSPRLR